MALAEPELTENERERRKQAVADMQAFAEKHNLTLGAGVHIKDLIHEGHSPAPFGHGSVERIQALTEP